MKGKINDLFKSVNEITVKQSKIISMVKSQPEKITDFTTKVHDLVLCLDLLAVYKESLKLRLASVEDKIISLQQSFADLNNVIGNN